MGKRKYLFKDRAEYHQHYEELKEQLFNYKRAINLIVNNSLTWYSEGKHSLALVKREHLDVSEYLVIAKYEYNNDKSEVQVFKLGELKPHAIGEELNQALIQLKYGQLDDIELRYYQDYILNGEN